MLQSHVGIVDSGNLSPNIRELVFEGDALRDAQFSAGDKVKLGVDGVLRSYTPAWWDKGRGRVSIVSHLHGQGPLSRWTKEAEVGDEALLIGPARSVRSHPQAAWALFYGDETALGLARALQDDLAVPLLGHIEVAAVDLPAVAGYELDATALARATVPGEALLHAARDTAIPSGDGFIWIAGRADSVVALWRHFQERGLPRSKLVVKPYWSEKGTAHRKAVARSL